jgi:hypothetical protein
MALSERELGELAEAVDLLERPSFIARLTDLLGQPLESLVGALPARTNERLHGVVRASLHRLLEISVKSLDRREGRPPDNLKHKLAGGLSGAVGGFFGGPALAVELPITTSIILRSIADIARSEGEDLTRLEARLACLEVFALGGRSDRDDGSETGYYAVRAALAKAVNDAARFIATRGLGQEGAPVLARLIAQISSRFGVVVSEKVAAQAVPVIGAIGGAGLNLLFMDHFQRVGRGHFVVRRLERSHEPAEIEAAYRRMRDAVRP